MTHTKLHAPEIIKVEKDVDQIACDGGDGSLGHPIVWYNFAGNDSVKCGYCDRTFIKK